MKREFNKEEFKKRFNQYFCHHEWFPKHCGDNRIVYVCQKCGKKLPEETMLEREFNFDRW